MENTNNQYFISPKSASLAVTYDATINNSTAVTLNAATKIILVTSLLKGTFLKWDTTASSTVFDEFIPPETTVAFVVPVGTVTANFIEEAASAHLVVIEK